MTRFACVSADLGVPVFGRKGCSIHVQEVLRSLIRQGAEAHLFTTSCQGEPPPGLEAVCLHALPRPSQSDRAVREQAELAANATLRRELELAGPFDFVYERYSLWSFAGMEFARDARVPGLLEVNSPLIEEQAEYRVLVDRAGAKRAAGRAFAAAAALLAVSDEVAAYLEGFPAARGKVQVMPNAVDPDRFPEKIKPALPVQPGGFTVGFVGTLKAWHGLPVLVEAFALLHARQPAARLLIVGDGPEFEKLVADVTARGLASATHFTGSVPAGEVAGLLAVMDVAVAPYPNLPQFYFSPLKVYEYMAGGLPVVASRIGQLEKLIEPSVNGLLVPPGDALALSAALELLCTKPELRSRLGRAGRATVLANHTWEKVARRILQIAGRMREPGQRPFTH
jgi:glycosyltransferase involved in cell wall biosynthesis